MSNNIPIAFHWLLSHAYSSFEEAIALNPLRNGSDRFDVPLIPNFAPELITDDGAGPRPSGSVQVLAYRVVRDGSLWWWKIDDPN